MIIHDLKLDMIPNKDRKEVWVSQYDTDFQIRIELFASSGTFTVPSGTTAAIRGTKPDGNGYSASASINENIVTVTGHEQMTVVSGKSVYELTLYRDSKELSTVNFILRVERAALDKDTPTSQSQTRELVDLEERADEIIAAVNSMEDYVGDSEAYAIGKRGGVDVTSGDAAYQNNAKYWAQRSAATNAAPQFDPSASYTAGEHVFQNGQLWCFNSAHSGAWTGTDATVVTIMGEVADLKDDFKQSDIGIGNAIKTSCGFMPFAFVNGYYPTNAVGYSSDISNPAQDDNYRCAIAPCTAGDVVLYGVLAGNEGIKSAYAFYDSNMISLARAGLRDQEIISSAVAPANAAYVVINTKAEYTKYYAFIGTSILVRLAGKQDTLTFDNAPIQSSNNVAKSGGIYSAIDASTMGVKGCLGDYSEQQKEISIGLDGYFVRPLNMSIQASQYYAITNPIAVNLGDIITVELCATSVIEAISYVDSSLTQSSFEPAKVGISPDTSTPVSMTFIAEKDGYIALCYWKAHGCTCKIISSNTNTYLGIKLRDVEISNYATGKYVSHVSQTLIAGSAYNVTDPIKVNKNDIIKVNGNAISGVELIAYCNATMSQFHTLLNGSQEASDTEAKEYSIRASKNGYICVSYKASVGCNISIIESDIDICDNGTYCDYNGNEISLLNKILCIGDSLTMGTFNPKTKNGSSTSEAVINSDYSYPAYLTKMYGVKTTNKGHGGLTAREWYEAHQNDDLSGHDSCIIYLGTNDAGLNPSASSTGWTSDSSQALTDIINLVKSQNALVKIFVCNMPPFETNNDNSVLRNRFALVNTGVQNTVLGLNDKNVSLIDLANYGHVTDEDYYEHTHLTALGYRQLAQDIGNYISYLISIKPMTYVDVQFAGTEYAM